MIFKLSGRYSRTTNEQLLNDLRQFAFAAGTDTITCKQYRQSGKYYASIFLRRFGSWNNALLHAGLTPKKHFKVPALLLFENLKTLWLALGRQPYASDLFPPLSRFGRKPYLRVFGSWLNALRAFVEWSNNNEETSTIPITEAPANTRTITWRMRYLVMKRDSFRCIACGASPANEPGTILHIDHVIPFSKGGTSIIDNLQTLCEVCNIGKGDMAA